MADDAEASIAPASAEQAMAAVETQHRLALRHLRAGALDAALTHLHALLLLAPSSPEAHYNLGVCLVQRGDHAGAILAFEQALRLRPVFFEARHNLVRALTDTMRLNEAEAQYARLIIDHPERLDASDDLTTWLFRSRGDDIEALNQHGIALHQAGRLAEARQCFESVLRQLPDHAFAHCNLGQVLATLGEPTTAEQHLRTAVRLDPTVDTLGALATWLGQLGRHEEAVETFRRAAALAPQDQRSRYNLAVALRAVGRIAEVIDELTETARRDPTNADIQSELGVALLDHSREADALPHLAVALALQPTSPKAHYNVGIALLALGRLEEGFREHEWRNSTDRNASVARSFAAPRWRGESFVSKTLLLHFEQGIGDTLQFSRYVPFAAARGGRVVIEVQPPLMELLRRSFVPAHVEVVPIAADFPGGRGLPAFNLHCELMSLPHVLGLAQVGVAARVPYLRADPNAVARWADRIRQLPGPRIGIVWAGSKVYPQDPLRSLPLERLAPLATAGGSLISLQKGVPAAPPAGMTLHEFTTELSDFADTAALIEALDLVISVDTAVAHLAGALGKPVWLLNRFDSDWRWRLGRGTSPWYPTMRVFDQPQRGDWDSVVTAVRDALATLCS